MVNAVGKVAEDGPDVEAGLPWEGGKQPELLGEGPELWDPLTEAKGEVGSPETGFLVSQLGRVSSGWWDL